ncbi:hypothetical protein [uncultured Erythrobacter sp.]|uniref:hypothetical protein n=1 Tax=uncultured Erythrobacter sp. TaxID=263913 RepID=UPI00262DF1E1|nr:hypothetical protein [uncultured Erythrobacter sp.]
MSISMPVKAVTLGAALALMAPVEAAYAQMRQEEPDAMDVARTPLEDFNIDAEDLPEVLEIAAQDPYDVAGVNSCNDIVERIAELDNVLGADFDLPQQDEDGISRGRVAKSVVGSFIPFRGIVREVSGANKRRNATRFAYTAGIARRSYLKGLGEGRGCSYPARPRRGLVEASADTSSNVPPNIPRGAPSDMNQDLAPVPQ